MLDASVLIDPEDLGASYMLQATPKNLSDPRSIIQDTSINIEDPGSSVQDQDINLDTLHSSLDTRSIRRDQIIIPAEHIIGTERMVNFLNWLGWQGDDVVVEVVALSLKEYKSVAWVQGHKNVALKVADELPKYDQKQIPQELLLHGISREDLKDAFNVIDFDEALFGSVTLQTLEDKFVDRKVIEALERGI